MPAAGLQKCAAAQMRCRCSQNDAELWVDTLPCTVLHRHLLKLPTSSCVKLEPFNFLQTRALMQVGACVVNSVVKPRADEGSRARICVVVVVVVVVGCHLDVWEGREA